MLRWMKSANRGKLFTEEVCVMGVNLLTIGCSST